MKYMLIVIKRLLPLKDSNKYFFYFFKFFHFFIPFFYKCSIIICRVMLFVIQTWDFCFFTLFWRNIHQRRSLSFSLLAPQFSFTQNFWTILMYLFFLYMANRNNKNVLKLFLNLSTLTKGISLLISITFLFLLLKRIIRFF